MRLAATRISERQNVLLTIQEVTFHQRPHMSADFRRKPFEVEVLRRLLKRQFGFTQKPQGPVFPAAPGIRDPPVRAGNAHS